MYSKFGYDLDNAFGFHYFRSELFRPWQFITYMFMHANVMHIFFNMFAIWMFGTMLEKIWGGKKFLMFYLITGFGAILIHLTVSIIDIEPLYRDAQIFFDNPNPDDFSVIISQYFSHINPAIHGFIEQWKMFPDDPLAKGKAIELLNNGLMSKINIPVIGASGSVFGVLVAFGMMFPNVRLMLLFPPIPLKAKYMVIGYIVLELYLGVSNFQWDNVAHYAHLGGGLFGFLLIKIWKEKKYDFIQ